MASTSIKIRSYQLASGDRVIVVMANEQADTNIFGKTTTAIVPLPPRAGFDAIHGNPEIEQALANRGRVCLAFADAEDADNFSTYMTDDGAVEVSDADYTHTADDYGHRDDEEPGRE